MFRKFTGRFHKLDHGPDINMILYGSVQPPEYNLTNIRTKVHVIYGTNDYLVKAEVCNFYTFSRIFTLSFHTLPTALISSVYKTAYLVSILYVF